MKFSSINLQYMIRRCLIHWCMYWGLRVTQCLLFAYSNITLLFFLAIVSLLYLIYLIERKKNVLQLFLANRNERFLLYAALIQSHQAAMTGQSKLGIIASKIYILYLMTTYRVQQHKVEG